MKSTDIVAYAYDAELLCPRCTLAALGVVSVLPVQGGSAQLKSEIAVLGSARGLDGPDDPRWKDSGTVPQPVLPIGEETTCDRCGEPVE